MQDLSFSIPYLEFTAYIWGILFFVFVPLFLIFSLILKNKLLHRKIFDLHQNKSQYIKEFFISARTFVIYQLAFTLIYFLYQRGWTALYRQFDQYGYAYILFAFLLIHFSHDAYFFYTHKLMHENPLFIKWHRTHHSARVPTPLSGNLFSVQEAVIHALFFVLAALLIPMPIHLLAFFFFFMNWINAWGHMEFEFWPNKLYRLPYAYTFNSVTHHNYHHYNAKGNYSLYHRHWDEWYGTLNPDTYKHFYKMREKIHQFLKKTYIPHHFRADRQDLVGQYFEIEYDNGENIDIFYEINGKKMPVPHSYTDGIGGLVRNLTELDVKLTSTPSKRHKKYTWQEIISIVNETNKSFNRIPTPWKKEWSNNPSNETSCAKFKLTADELQQVKEKAKKLNVTLNTLFIYEFDKVLKKYVKSPKRFTWAIPVSYRKEIYANMDPRNQVWFVDLTSKSLGINLLHQKLQRLYGDIDLFHGTAKLWMNYPLRYFLYPLIWWQRAFKFYRNAAFSNLGSFSGDKDLEVYFCPPVVRSCPVSIGNVTYNGQSFFTITTHPSVNLSKNGELEKISHDFKTNLMEN